MNNQDLIVVHKTDADGNPAGGYAEATGLQIRWQDGPLGRDRQRKEPNGAFVETALRACVDRLDFYQTAKDGRFECGENARAIHHIEMALAAMAERTARREAAAVEGTHEGN